MPSAVFILSYAQAAGAESSAASGPTATDEQLVAQEKQRLEDLFISKMSQELKLEPEAKRSFAEAIRSLNREKTKANGAVAEALIAIEKAQTADRAKSKKEIEKAVKSYESAWRQYGALPLREVSRLRAILGQERLARYLIVKSVMAEKLTALSAAPAPSPSPAAPAVKTEGK